MSNGYFSGLKLSSAVLVLMMITAGLYFGACSSDKGEKKEQVEETKPEVKTPEEPSANQPAAQTGEDKGKTREGLPPEISAPCVGKSEGDPCVVVVTGGAEIKGTCKMSQRKNLACAPDPILNKDKVQEPDGVPGMPETPGGN